MSDQTKFIIVMALLISSVVFASIVQIRYDVFVETKRKNEVDIRYFNRLNEKYTKVSVDRIPGDLE